jgi:kinesin family protein 5
MKLRIRERPDESVFVEGLLESYAASERDIFALLARGEANRHVSATDMNAHSSRSHTLLMLTVQQRAADGSVRVGRLNFAGANLPMTRVLCGLLWDLQCEGLRNQFSFKLKIYLLCIAVFIPDLAGSEKVKKTSASGKGLEEAKKINQSLSALGNCIMALTEADRGHVPFRDSKLTYILKNSLGGNAKTTLLVTCSPHVFNSEETLSTLRFAQRAKMIKNTVTINRQRSAAELLVLLQRAYGQVHLR